MASLPASSGPASADALVILWSALFRYVMQLGQALMLCALLFNPPDPFFKGVVRACGLSIAAWFSLLASSGPASEDALVVLRTLLLRFV